MQPLYAQHANVKDGKNFTPIFFQGQYHAPQVFSTVPTPVISAALFERLASRGDDDYANRLVSAMRKQFGGHDEKKEGR
jgi:6-phosphogluconate dehydrogenase (decarboxylating)